MIRMRTLPQALEEIKKIDPASAISYPTLRRWCKSGYVPFVRNGSHYLVNLDALLSFLEIGEEVPPREDC